MKNQAMVKNYYVFGKKVTRFESMDEAMQNFNKLENSNGYKALGVDYTHGLDYGVGSCDFIVQNGNDVKFSQDFKSYNVQFDTEFLDNMVDVYYWILTDKK